MARSLTEQPICNDTPRRRVSCAQSRLAFELVLCHGCDGRSELLRDRHLAAAGPGLPDRPAPGVQRRVSCRRCGIAVGYLALLQWKSASRGQLSLGRLCQRALAGSPRRSTRRQTGPPVHRCGSVAQAAERQRRKPRQPATRAPGSAGGHGGAGLAGRAMSDPRAIGCGLQGGIRLRRVATRGFHSSSQPGTHAQGLRAARDLGLRHQRRRARLYDQRVSHVRGRRRGDVGVRRARRRRQPGAMAFQASRYLRSCRRRYCTIAGWAATSPPMCRIGARRWWSETRSQRVSCSPVSSFAASRYSRTIECCRIRSADSLLLLGAWPPETPRSNRQDNALLYSTTLPAGPFEIDDLYPTGYGGDLQVTVTESDGSQKVTTVPFSSLPQLLREGTLDYSLGAGQLLGYRLGHDTVQGTVQFGLNNMLTLNGGLLATKEYGAMLVGGALNSAAGAFQMDMSVADFTTGASQDHRGWSRIVQRRARSATRSPAPISFAASRYSSSGFYSLDDAMHRLDYDRTRRSALGHVPHQEPCGAQRQPGPGRRHVVLRVGHQSRLLGLHGARDLVPNGRQQAVRLVQLFSATRGTPMPGGTAQSAFTFGLNMPLGTSSSARGNVSASLSHDSLNGDSRQVGVYGYGGDQGQLSYGVSEQGSRLGNALSASSTYRDRYATVGATASAGRHANQQSVTAPEEWCSPMVICLSLRPWATRSAWCMSKALEACA